MSFIGFRSNVSFIGFRYKKSPLSDLVFIKSFIGFQDDVSLSDSKVLCPIPGLEVLCGV
jgi:hypothetical protein